MPVEISSNFGDREAPANAVATNLFERASRFDTLWRAWERVRANNGAAGGDGVSCDRFAVRAENSISRLSHALRHGLYRPAPVRRVEIPKRSGGTRPLDIPSIVDRVAQGAVAATIGPVVDAELEDSSYAYRPGRSVAQAIQKIASLRRQGFQWVVDGDIVRYFERIPHDRLLSILDRHLSDERLVDLVGIWLEQHSPVGVGIPQGSPLSPLLANLYLDGVDEAIEGKGIRLVRFADDFVILCRDQDLANTALERMRLLLAQNGLELHPEKTRLVSFDQGFRFLGHVIVRSMVWKEVGLDDTPTADVVEATERVLAAALAGPTSEDAEASLPAEEARGRWSPRRRVLYLVEPKRRLATDGDHFVVLDGEARIHDLPCGRVDRIEIGPAVDIDIDALDLGARSDTEIVRVDGRGFTLGRWVGNAPGNAERHLRQAAAVLDERRRAEIASGFVSGRIFNQRVLLKRLDRDRRHPDHEAVAMRLGRLARKTEKLPMPVASLMAHEGEAAALYWKMLGSLVGAPWSIDGRRRRRVGADPFNVVLDVYSSMLLRDCRSALERAGLHPGYAFLHSADVGEDALSWDLAEEFRAPVVEAGAAAAFSRKVLRDGAFEQSPNGYRLTREGWKAAIRHFEGWLQRPIMDPLDGERTFWRGLVDRQAERLAAAIESAGAYQPYHMDY